MSMAAQAPSRRDAATGSIKPRVLIVEDETALVELLRYNLEQSGFRVSVAELEGIIQVVTTAQGQGPQSS